jgi:hypothetical protein
VVAESSRALSEVISNAPVCGAVAKNVEHFVGRKRKVSRGDGMRAKHRRLCVSSLLKINDFERAVDPNLIMNGSGEILGHNNNERRCMDKTMQCYNNNDMNNKSHNTNNNKR